MAIKKAKDEKVKKTAKKTKEKPVKAKKAKKAKAESEEEEKPKKTKKNKESEDEAGFKFDAYADLDSMLDTIEKETGMSGGGLGKRVTTSTGLLTLDLILGGGLTSGSWNTFYGGEQSSKSTLSMTQLAVAAVHREIPVLMYFDFEGSYDAQYMLSLARVHGFKGDITDLFGIQDDDGNYVKKPIIRKYSASVAEKFFNMVYKLEKNLPDKMYKKGVWWHVYEGTKENKAKYGSLANTKYLKKTGNLWIEAPNDQPQALIVVDSYPAMLPANMDDDDGKAGIGAQARMFSEQLKRIKGRMMSKGVTIMGINQLRQKPMVMFGCLHGETKIPLVDGRSFNIKELVENKVKGEVWSWDEENQKLRPAKIKNWFYNGEVQHKSDWITISTNEVAETKNGTASVTVTPNHKILTAAGWKKAQDVMVGDKVLSKYTSFFEGDIKPVMAGVLVGDSCIVADCKNAHLRLQDSLNEEYVAWKRSLLSGIFTFVRRGTAKQTWISNRYYQLSKLKERLGERNPIKVERWMTPLSLAIWYMDDGCYQEDRDRSSLCIARFKNDLELMSDIQEMLSDKFGLDSTNVGKSLLFNTENTHKLHKLICKFVPASMQYKLSDVYKGQYKAPKVKTIFKPKKNWCEVTSIDVGSDRKFRLRGKYDIEVEGTHNYMAGSVSNGFIVHNSPEYEPGGEALKFFSDMRLKMVSRAVPPGEPRKKNSSSFAEEDSIEFKGSKDTYRYVHIRATKNKLSSGSDMEGWVRIWVRDGSGNAKGYDPVFDTYEFMKSLGLLSGSRNRIKLDFDALSIKGLKGSHSVSWNDFKRLIVGDKKQIAKVLDGFKFTGKRFNIRDKLFALIRSGEAQKMYFETVKVKAAAASDASDDD